MMHGDQKGSYNDAWGSENGAIMMHGDQKREL